MRLRRFHGGQWIQKQLMNRRTQQLCWTTLQQALGRGVDQRDAPVETGGDQSAADGVDDVLVQRLQAFQRAAGVLQLYAHLPQFRGEQSGQISHRQEREEIDKDNGLQRLRAGMGGAVGRNYGIVVQFQHRSVKDESQSGDELRPHARQQHAGHDDDQGIEEVQGTVPPAGLVDHEADHDQIGHNLQRGLQTVLLPEREKKYVEEREAVPQQNGCDEEPHGHRARAELGDRQFNGQQEGQNKNADPDQPYQPIALIKRRLHYEDRRFQSFKVQSFKVSRFQSVTRHTLKP